jgi:hypothetical protein
VIEIDLRHDGESENGSAASFDRNVQEGERAEGKTCVLYPGRPFVGELNPCPVCVLSSQKLICRGHEEETSDEGA